MRPKIEAKTGAGALSKFARMLVKPRDCIMVAPHVDNPPADCRPLRQMIK